MQTMIPPVGTQAGLMFADDHTGHSGAHGTGANRCNTRAGEINAVTVIEWCLYR